MKSPPVLIKEKREIDNSIFRNKIIHVFSAEDAVQQEIKLLTSNFNADASDISTVIRSQKGTRVSDFCRDEQK